MTEVVLTAADESFPADRDADPVADDVLNDDKRKRQLHERHRFMLGLALSILLASFILQVREPHRVSVPWVGVSLPPMCGSRAFFDAECPGCGLTRSFIALAAGDVAGSLRFHRVGWVLFAAVVMQIPYRLFAIRELRTKGIVERSWPAWLGSLLIALLIGNWLIKVTALL